MRGAPSGTCPDPASLLRDCAPESERERERERESVSESESGSESESE